ncbi:MAG: CPBP family intramembrane metalloprotease [Dysgonamonadaceae bacterium]|jgi:membrane protease YdiL (CAAX protease family)|nr:CPBP family intramembrane metalloprotease [Dysgonamonadaceae bacterium]
MQRVLSSSTDRSRLFYLFFFAFLGLFLSAILMGLIFGVEVDAVRGVWEIRFSSFVQALLMFFLPAYAVFAWSFPQPFRALKLLKTDVLWKNIAWGVVILCIACPFTSFLTQLNKEMVLPASMSGIEQWIWNYEQQAKGVADLMLSGKSISGLLVNLLLVAGFAAVAEELFFRGALQQLWQGITKSRHLAVWTTAFIFSAIHLQFYGFLPRLVLGAMLGYLFSYSGNLWVSIAVHFLNNAIVISAMYYRNFNPEAVNRIDNLPITLAFTLIAVVSLILTVALFWWRDKENQKAFVSGDKKGGVL